MTLRDEFNLQSPYTKSALLCAVVWAAPGIVLSSAQYGWAGMALAGTLMAGLGWYRSREIHHDIAHKHDHARKWATYQTVEPQDERLQSISDEIATRMDLPIQPTAHVMDDPAFIAGADETRIWINRNLAETLDDKALSWLVAHEADHIKNAEHDQRVSAFYQIAHTLNLFGGFTAVLQALEPEFSLLPAATVVAATAVTLYGSHACISRQIEYTRDANALRVTGDKDAATNALDTVHEMNEDFFGEERLDRRLRKGPRYGPFASHPRRFRRIENLEETWTAMQAEKSSTPPAPPGP